MKSQIFSADASTDTLTITAHGYLTGDGPAVALSEGTLPGGLAAVTSYYVIRIDADHLKLATSAANALAGTAINITDAGSGVHRLLSGVPFARPRNLVAGVSQIRAAETHDAWDSLIALQRLVTRQPQSVIPGIRWKRSIGPILVAGLAPNTVYRIPADVGDQLVSVTVAHVGSAWSGELRDGYFGGGGWASTQFATVSATPPDPLYPDNYYATTFSGFTPVTLLAGHAFELWTTHGVIDILAEFARPAS